MFVLHVAWFYVCLVPKSTIQWYDITMSIGCGPFKFLIGKIKEYIVTQNISHVVAT